MEFSIFKLQYSLQAAQYLIFNRPLPQTVLTWITVKLLDQERLLKSDVVANNLMNRERGCLAKNSYQKDLAFNPIEFLQERLIKNKLVSWLDICCGRARALIETAAFFAGEEADKNISNNLEITGIDLAGGFYEPSEDLNSLKLLEMAIEDFKPETEFDLITCVHGLHYIGDKLSVIQKAAGWLKPDGIFMANLDLKNLRLSGEANSNRAFSDFFRRNKFAFHSGKHLLVLEGRQDFDLPFEYLGADSQAGANYSGQLAVNSYYKKTV